LNQLEILACDIQNAYLTADCREKIYVIAEPEFGSEEGKVMIVRKALYGLKTSGAAFRAHMAETLYDLGYKPSVQILMSGFDQRLSLTDSSTTRWCLYMSMTYSVFHMIRKRQPMAGIQKTFKLKDDKIEKPETYLGAQLSQVVIKGQLCWTMSSHNYVKAAVANVEAALDASGQRLPSRCSTPIQSNYRPKLDTTPELNLKGMRYYQEQIELLRWAVELGRIDIAMEISMRSTHLAAPSREGHLQQVYHCVAYLKATPKRTLAFDSQHPLIDESRFVKCDWHDFYRGA
jgi:hypothetical protein